MLTRLKALNSPRSAGAVVGDARQKTPRMSTASVLVLVAGLTASMLSVGLVAAAPANAGSGYEIINGRTGLRADVMWASTSKGQGVFLWPDNTSKSQQFDLARVNDGTGDYTIKAQHSGQCLWLGYWKTGWGNGSKVIQYPCNSHYSASRWYTDYVYYKAPSCGTWCFNSSGWRGVIKNRATGKCLDAENGNFPAAPRQQARLQQWDCVTSGNAANIGNQWWKLEAPGGPIIR